MKSIPKTYHRNVGCSGDPIPTTRILFLHFEHGEAEDVWDEGDLAVPRSSKGTFLELYPQAGYTLPLSLGVKNSI